MSAQSTREYIQHLKRAAGPGSRAEILQNALADFLGQVSKSGDRSPREALEKIRSLDTCWQQLAAAAGTMPHGFRQALAVFYPAATTRVLFNGLGWDFDGVLRDPGTPWGSE